MTSVNHAPGLAFEIRPRRRDLCHRDVVASVLGRATLAPVSLCLCPRSSLCPSCLAALEAQLRGTAACRGDAWAEAVARRRPQLHRRPWPAYKGRTAAIARGKVADLGADPKLLDALARACHAQAANSWASSPWWERVRSERG